MSTTTKWAAGTNAVLGLWLIIAPFVFDLSSAGLWNAVVVGSLVTLGGGYNWYLATKGDQANRTVAYSVGLLGLWVLVAPFVLGVGTAATWNDVIVGATVAGLGGYNGYESSTNSQSQPQPT